jgi:ABC-2 type transport system permease protein
MQSANARRWSALAVIALAQFMVIMDTSIIGVALPEIVYLTTGMLVGVAFGAILLASAPAIVALFALPITWTAVATLSFFADAAPWLDTRLALAPLHQEVLSATQWAQAGTALALWMLLPLLIGIWRIRRREVAA